MIPLSRPHPQATYFVPEVVQTSMMDCGPAALQSLVRGFGMSVNYGRLREACQTSVDGTSISTMDEIASFLGLETEETMLPADHLLLPAANALPAIVVVNTSNGNHHFVVVWSVVGPWVQVMDPAEGRQWIPRSELFERLYIHHERIPATAWRVWVAEREFLGTLHARLEALAIPRADRERLCAMALANPGWQSMSALDAATRMTAALVANGAIVRGPVCLALIERQTERAPDGSYPLIPREYESAWHSRTLEGDAEEFLRVRGVVLVRARGRRAAAALARTAHTMPAELAHALTDDSVRPWRTLLRLLVANGITASTVFGLMLVSAALVTMNALLLRGILEMGHQLGLPAHRAAAMGALLGFFALGLCIELPLVAGALRLSRALELRIRMAFLIKLPRLDDRYLRSRLLSDMAERGHALYLIRSLPLLGVRLLAASAQLLFTVAGIAWLAPTSAPLALLAAGVCIGLPLACQPLMAERDLRLRSHSGALGRFYLDALLGLLPIRLHGARLAMQQQQQALLKQWARAGIRFYAASTSVEGVLALASLGMAVLVVWSVSGESPSSLLLLVYWALSLPALGQEIAVVARQYPVLRNVMLRLLEPLGAPEPIAPVEPTPAATAGPAAAHGAAIRMSGVSIEAAGSTILADLELEIASGEHIAIVGPSGAGKSSLVGLLLGWHQPACGAVHVDGGPLVGDALRRLRRNTAWVDPAVTLWNRSFLDNLCYGADLEGETLLPNILAKARLREVLERLPDGLVTQLGEGGALVSGGEGQRTRVGRAMARGRARLVILDEPFRGLDRDTRRELLKVVRAWWSDATLLWVTHDIAETMHLPRVLVIDGGLIVEDGNPAVLGARPESRYAALIRGDREMHEHAWSSEQWRRVWVEHGQLREEDPSS